MSATLTEIHFPPSIVRKYAKRVDRGAALLDERLPGWWRHIRLTQLNMGQGVYTPGVECGCVGAQVAHAYADLRDEYSDGRSTGFFDNAMTFLFGYTRGLGRKEVAHGFVAGRPEDSNDAYLLLDELWAEKVRERRRASRA